MWLFILVLFKQWALLKTMLLIRALGPTSASWIL